MFWAYEHLLPCTTIAQGEPSVEEVKAVASEHGHRPYKMAVYSPVGRDDSVLSSNIVELVSWPFFTDGKVFVQVRIIKDQPHSAIWVDANLVRALHP